MVIVRNIRNHPYFEEGHWYDFTILKEVNYPDGKKCWVLEDNQGVKHLLPAEYYTDYNIKTDDVIHCKIDKINCTGKIYLEPAHPYYRAGRTYEFEVTAQHILPDVVGDSRGFWILRDVFGKEMQIAAPDDYKYPNPPKTVHCKVIRIKKGQIYLRHVHEALPISNLTKGLTYEFEVFETMHEHDGEIYFILIGPDGLKHPLKQKHFQDYGIETRDLIQCELVGFYDDESLILEPEHPFYKPGQFYSFTLIEPEDDLKGYQPTENEIIIKDIFQNLIIVDKTNSEKQQMPAKRVIRKVLGMRRGVPVLQ